MPFANDVRACAIELWQLAYTTPPGCEAPFLDLSTRLSQLARTETQRLEQLAR